tara:strand:- start:239 stop:499 length:261 start_codon:yes stop_codon:yes gene_type:complete
MASDNAYGNHITTCTTLLEGDAQTEYHNGPEAHDGHLVERCPACDREFAEINEGERRAEFGFGWVVSGGDPADAGLAYLQDQAEPF